MLCGYVYSIVRQFGLIDVGAHLGKQLFIVVEI